MRPRNRSYYDEWNAVAERIVAVGGGFSEGEIIAISDNLNFEKMKPEFYPSDTLASKSPKARILADVELTTLLWGMTASKWLALEKGWLKQAREASGNSRDDSKDDLDEVVSPEILARIYSVAFLFYQTKMQKLELDPDEALRIRISALRKLNNFIDSATDKGYSRATLVKQEGSKKKISTYSFLADQGIPSGPFGKYLPNPLSSFPQLILLLHRLALKKGIYHK